MHRGPQHKDAPAQGRPEASHHDFFKNILNVYIFLKNLSKIQKFIIIQFFSTIFTYRCFTLGRTHRIYPLYLMSSPYDVLYVMSCDGFDIAAFQLGALSLHTLSEWFISSKSIIKNRLIPTKLLIFSGYFVRFICIGVVVSSHCRTPAS